MFVRWKTKQTGKKTTQGQQSHYAELLHSERIGRKVRHHRIANFGHFSTTDGKLTEADADAFWRNAMAVLRGLGYPPCDAKPVALQLAARVRQHVEWSSCSPSMSQ